MRLFLAYCDVDDGDLAEVRHFFARSAIDVELVDMQPIAEQIEPVKARRWPRAAYLRLHFDSLFGPEHDRLVYFDADTRVLASLEPLIEADLRGQPVGAVHDFIYYVTGHIHRRRRELYLAQDGPYLQSGVMVFDWPATLATDILGRARQFLKDHPDRCREAPDQDALNAALKDHWTPLDPRWNLHQLYLQFGGRLRPYVEHYTSTKPWARDRPPAWRDAADWYRRELSGTAWADFIPPQGLGDRMSARAAFWRLRYRPHLIEALDRLAPSLRRLVQRIRRGRAAVFDDRGLPWVPRDRRVVEDMATALIAEAQNPDVLLRPPEAVVGERAWHASTPNPRPARSQRRSEPI
jgi:lipopolysaccharide biosynthesis glycosyltransferase